MKYRPELSKRIRTMANWFVIIAAAALLFYVLPYQGPVEEISYRQFLNYLDQGLVASVSVDAEKITGTFKDLPKESKKRFSTLRMEDQSLTDRLLEAQVEFTALPKYSFFWGMISFLSPIIILYLFWSLLFQREGLTKGGGFLALGKSKAKVFVETKLKTRFADVAGVDEAKEELKEIVDFLKNPERYSKLGGRMPKGILLVGPPGTGKTLLARAVAGEAGVPFFSINGSEFVELFVGLGAARVRDLFEQGRKTAPCIIFIDELDALGKARGISAVAGGANDEKEQTLNQLLAEMDGFDPSQGIILLSATNRPEILDPALLRAGRFDRHILVDKPDKLGREKILEIHLKKITLTAKIDLSAIAAMTAGFSGADLANLANEAALIATRRGAQAVEAIDFTEAVERIVAGLEKKNRLLTADEKKRVAFHEIGHAVVSLALGQGEIIHKVSIIPRGISALGYTMRRPIEDRYLMTKEELEAKIAVLLGGRAAEITFFKNTSTGSGDDLDKATEIARAMVTRYGMGTEPGLAVYEREPSFILGSQFPIRAFEYSEKSAEVIDSSVEEFLYRALNKSLSIIARYKAFVEEAAAELLVKETIDEAYLNRLWEKHTKKPSLISNDQMEIQHASGDAAHAPSKSDYYSCL